jgi:tRNA A37 N6-isopentenylltransferase MiaA
MAEVLLLCLIRLDCGFVNKIVAVTGITASGKTALSIKIAKRFNGEIVSCDSRQVYKYLDIGTAKITPLEMDGIPHHLIDIIDPTKNTHYSVAQFQRDAYAVIDGIISRGKLPILVGGTGLYSRSVINGYNFDGNNALRYDALQICLIPPKAVIVPKVIVRNEERIANGMFDETKKLLEIGVAKKFLLNLGLEYKLNVMYLDGKLSLDEYKKQLYIKTMQFIKRQRTWYRKENPAITHYSDNPEEYEEYANIIIQKFISAEL